MPSRSSAKRAWVKWPGELLAGLLVVLFAAFGLVLGKGTLDLYRPYPVAAVNISIAGTSEQVAKQVLHYQMMPGHYDGAARVRGS